VRGSGRHTTGGGLADGGGMLESLRSGRMLASDSMMLDKDTETAGRILKLLDAKMVLGNGSSPSPLMREDRLAEKNRRKFFHVEKNDHRDWWLYVGPEAFFSGASSFLDAIGEAKSLMFCDTSSLVKFLLTPVSLVTNPLYGCRDLESMALKLDLLGA